MIHYHAKIIEKSPIIPQVPGLQKHALPAVDNLHPFFGFRSACLRKYHTVTTPSKLVKAAEARAARLLQKTGVPPLGMSSFATKHVGFYHVFFGQKKLVERHAELRKSPVLGQDSNLAHPETAEAAQHG